MLTFLYPTFGGILSPEKQKRTAGQETGVKEPHNRTGSWKERRISMGTILVGIIFYVIGCILEDIDQMMVNKYCKK